MAPFLAYWVHDWKPFLVQFTDTIGIRYYGLAYIVGFWGGAWWLNFTAKRGRSRLPAEKTSDLLISLILGVVVGGRLGYFLFYHSDWLVKDPLVIFRVWEGGMAFHGGLLGVAIALFWFARQQRVPFLHLADLICAIAPFGLMLGRIANFINGELWGKPSFVPWAVIFPMSGMPGQPVSEIAPRHPSQLYEAALEGLVLLAFMQWRFWRTDATNRTPGRIAGEFLLGYAAARIVCELFREPDADLLLGLSRGTFYSVFLVLAGVSLMITSSRASRADATN